MGVGLNPATLIFLDDLVGTGRSLAKNLSHFVEKNETLLRELDVPVTCMVLAITSDGDEMVRNAMRSYDWPKFDLRYVNLIGPENQAFPEGLGIWTDMDEKERAKSLCGDIGVRIYPRNPFGFGDQGLLINFSVNCPNNTLPIMHSPSRDDASRVWHPLFPRAIH